MSEIKHTPGPWILATVPTSVGSCHKIGPFPGAGHRPYTFACVYADGIRPGIDDKLPAAIELTANARLIAAAPELLEELSKIIANAEQKAFEDWLRRECPSGDVEQVQRQWDDSYDFSEFCDEWDNARAAIAKARGQS